MVDIQSATKIELHISCEGLINKDTFSKSDPYCIVLMQNRTTLEYYEISRTEVVKNNLDPVWRKAQVLDFHFETKQALCFKVRDSDESGKCHLGKAMTTLGEIVSLGSIKLNLTKQGKITIKAEEVSSHNTSYEFQLRGADLDNKGMCCFKNDPFLVINKSIDGKWIQVAKTNTVKNTLNPRWENFKVSSQKLCNNDLTRPVKFECFDKKFFGAPVLIGSAEQIFQEVSKAAYEFQIFSNDENKAVAKSSGSIRVHEVTQRPLLSFVDYLRAGVEITCSVAIDFTASNGNRKDPNSLHFIRPDAPNQYEKAILEIGGILENYDTDKKFFVYGFGGNLSTTPGLVNHCFHLHKEGSHYIDRVAGILDRYHAAIKTIGLSGPTFFHPMLDFVSEKISEKDPKKAYNIFLILTDGAIMDMPQTKSSIVKASKLPLSIIIVGIGNADFSSMSELDGDEGKLKDENGNKAVRDIVQFVPFNKFSGDAVALAAEVLKEVPRQLTDYMEMINYSPEVHHERIPSILSGAVIPVIETPQADISNPNNI